MVLKSSIVPLLVLLAVATALAATTSVAQRDEAFFSNMKAVLLNDGKINTLIAGFVLAAVFALTVVVRGPREAELSTS
jgi:hypothetical protein